jgi:putative ABC transport system permease protein
MELWRRLGFLLRRRRFDRDLEEEMRFHLEMKSRKNREAGVEAEEAEYAARRSFGNALLLREKSRDAWGWRAVETLAQDVRFTLRMMRKNPAFTAVAILVLALGIGANTAIFSMVQALLLNPYPFPEPDQLMSVQATHRTSWTTATGYREFLDWQQQNTVFEDMAIVPWTATYTLTGNGEPQRLIGGETTASFFEVLGVQPLFGRFFTEQETGLGSQRLVLLSYAAWQNRFGGRADILGRKVVLNETPYTVIGVMPSRFAFPGRTTCEFWTPLRDDPVNSRGNHQYSVIARLKAGIPIARAQADMSAIARRNEQLYPWANKGWGVVVSPLARTLAKQAAAPLAVLFATVVLVLLLACVNLAGLMLARASGRVKEMTIRVALGASRLRIVRQMLTESVLLSIVGACAGLVFANWLMEVLRKATPAGLGLDAALRLDSRVLEFTFAASVLTGVVFGLAPALYGSRSGLSPALTTRAESATGTPSRGRLLGALVAGEVALAVVLLVGAGLLVKDLMTVLHLDTGVRAEHVLTFALDLPHSMYSTPQRTSSFYEELLSRLRASPGIQSAAAVGTLPMTGGYSGSRFEIEGHPEPADLEGARAQDNISTPGYFRTIGIRLLLGRDFDERDTATSHPVMIVNEEFARRFFPSEDPIGKRIQTRDWRTIVGVVGSVKHQQPWRLPQPMMYVPHAQDPGGFMWVTVRTAGDPEKLALAVRGTVRSLDLNLPVLSMRTMREVVSDSVNGPRLLASFLAGFAGFALVLAATGIYGVVAYSVSQRTHEMGVRIALGASYRDVLALVAKKAAVLAATGVLIGVPAALGVSRLIGSLLHGTRPLDITVFVSVPAVLLAVALAASYVPARRAARIDPMEALRCE